MEPNNKSIDLVQDTNIMPLQDAFAETETKAVEKTEIQSEENTSIDLVAVEKKGSKKAGKDPLQEVLDRLEKLEKENEELKRNSLSESIKKRKEKYGWPWMYSYKMIDWKPITEFKTLKNEVRKNYAKGWYITEQVVELTFADWTTQEMNYDDFAQTYERSPKIFVEEKKIKQGKTHYVFEVDWESFSVADNIIN